MFHFRVINSYLQKNFTLIKMAASSFYSNDLNSELDNTIDQLVGPDPANFVSTSRYGSWTYLLLPLIVALVLYFIQPKFVTMIPANSTKPVLCKRRLALWTAIISMTVGASYYFYLSSGFTVPGFMKPA